MGAKVKEETLGAQGARAGCGDAAAGHCGAGAGGEGGEQRKSSFQTESPRNSETSQHRWLSHN